MNKHKAIRKHRSIAILVVFVSACVIFTKIFFDSRYQSNVLVVFNSSQIQNSSLIECQRCTYLDLSRNSNTPPVNVPVIILDGHSLTGNHVLGRTETSIAKIIANANPEIVIGLTCYAAEYNFLKQVFETPSVKKVAASPKTLPWQGFSIKEECSRRHWTSLYSCVTNAALMNEYTRDDLVEASGQQAQLVVDIQKCSNTVQWARFHPHYACIKLKSGKPMLVRIEADEIKAGCYIDNPFRSLVPCS